MKYFTSVDTKTEIRKEDCFYLQNIGNERFELAIAVARKNGFYKNQNQAACIVLRLIITEKGEILSSSFTNEVVILKNSHDFVEYNIILENLYGTKKYFFLETLLEIGSKITSKKLKTDSAEDLIECFMSIFTYYAKNKYKVNCTKYGRQFSPKNNLYRFELYQKIKLKEKRQQNNISKKIAA